MRAALVRASIESEEATRALEETTHARRMVAQYEQEVYELEMLTNLMKSTAVRHLTSRALASSRSKSPVRPTTASAHGCRRAAAPSVVGSSGTGGGRRVSFGGARSVQSMPVGKEKSLKERELLRRLSTQFDLDDLPLNHPERLPIVGARKKSVARKTYRQHAPVPPPALLSATPQPPVATYLSASSTSVAATPSPAPYRRLY